MLNGEPIPNTCPVPEKIKVNNHQSQAIQNIINIFAVIRSLCSLTQFDIVIAEQITAKKVEIIGIQII